MTEHPDPPQRRLIVMRHAKSSHDDDARTDHARPLAKRGRRDAPRVAAQLAAMDWAPDFIISSDSRRTRETLEGLLEGLGADVPHVYCAELYGGGYRELVSVGALLPAAAETVLALGHNPGWEELVRTLSGEAVVLKTATCALLALAHACPWPTALRTSGWRLEDIFDPAELDE
jgi:phosphohistidine phosphatase